MHRDMAGNADFTRVYPNLCDENKNHIDKNYKKTGNRLKI